MRHRYLLWTGHLIVIVFLFRGIFWVTENIRGMSGINLFLALAAMTCLVVNHVRWWALDKKVSQEGILGKIDQLMMGNYGVLALLLLLIRF